MSVYYTLLTNAGAAAMAFGAAHGTPVVLTQVALGDGNGTVPNPTAATTTLVHEVYRAPINSITQHDVNPSWYVIELVIPPEIGGFTIREFRVDTAAGVAVYVGNTAPETKPIMPEGMTRDSIYRLIVETSNSAEITLIVDPSIVMATHQYVANAVAEHEAKEDPHPIYLTKAEADAFYESLGIAASGFAGHLSDPDPHPQYITQEELDANGRARRHYFANL